MMPLVVSVAFGRVASKSPVVPVFPSILAIQFDMVRFRKWIGQSDPEERAPVA
jgi:hypothetical protein